MTDTELLNSAIDKSGLMRKFIASNMGISRHTLINKTKGDYDFTVTEIDALSRLLNLTNDDLIKIFFTLKSE